MLFLIFALLTLTAPSGKPIYIARDQIVVITTNEIGDNRARSVVVTAFGSYYVRETPEEVKQCAEGRGD